MARQYGSGWTEAAIYLTSGEMVAIVSMDYDARQFMIKEEFQDPPCLHEPVQIVRYPGQSSGLGVSSIVTSVPNHPGGSYAFVTADDEDFDSTPIVNPKRTIR